MVCQNDGNGYSKENSDIKKGPDIHRAAALLVEEPLQLYVDLEPNKDVQD